MTSHADFIRRLDRPETELAAFCEDLTNTPEDEVVRAGVGAVIEPTVKERAPGALPGLIEILEVLGRYRPLAFMPMRDLMVQHVWLAHHWFPDLPLERACNQAVKEVSTKLNQQPVFQPLIIACDHSVRRFATQLPSSANLFFRDGEISFHPGSSPGAFSLRYDGFSYCAWKYFLHGYYNGLIGLFGVSGEADLDRISDSILEIHLRLD